MSTEKKTISINTDFFKVSNKTQKAGRPKKPAATSIIPPNVLRKKLLDRIKKHKAVEAQKVKTASTSNKKTDSTDELTDSMQYFNLLSSERKMGGEVKGKEKTKEKEKTKDPILHSSVFSNHKTFKNHASLMGGGGGNIPIQLELPDTLQEISPSFVESFHTQEPILGPVIPSPIQLNYKVDDKVPYGCLKGGIKPTFRAYNKTMRSEDEMPLSWISGGDPVAPLAVALLAVAPLAVAPLAVAPPLNESAKRWTALKGILDDTKLKAEGGGGVQEGAFNPTADAVSVAPPLIEAPKIEIEVRGGAPEKKEEIKTAIKKTIRRKYVLGRSKNGENIGILIKDRQTRKKVLKAQTNLKKKPIHDVKQFLKDRGLLKIGSPAPHDVLRKMYESSMLSGDIFNHNSDTLLHNFMEDKNKD